MKIKIKTVLFGISLFFNAVFFLLIILASFQKKALLSYFNEDGYIASAAVVGVPASGDPYVAFGRIEISISPGQTAFLQYSVCAPGRSQGNLIISALYDPEIVSVKENGYGIEITALSYGSCLVQTVSNTGIKDVALVTVK